MKKNTKLNLKDLKVKSFKTSAEKKEIKGGIVLCTKHTGGRDCTNRFVCGETEVGG